MAETKKEIRETDPWQETREVYVPLVRGEERTLPVSVNDRDFAVPKGQRVQVPMPVYYVIQNMLDMQKLADEAAEKDLSTHDRGVIR